MTTQPTPLESPRFDAYWATIREDPEEVWNVLAGTLGADVVAGKGLHGYARSSAVVRRGETLARVLYGGVNGAPHVIAQGAATDDVGPVIRGAWPAHEVARADSAQDFDQQGGYDALRTTMLALIQGTNITLETLESVRNGVLSRTTYLGSRKSRIRVRLYEKGRKEQQDGQAASDHWVRLELQAKFTGQHARTQAADVGPADAWGVSRWTRQLAADAMQLDVLPITQQLRREPDYQRALHHLVRTYGATLARALEVEGSWEAVRVLLEEQGAVLSPDDTGGR